MQAVSARFREHFLRHGIMRQFALSDGLVDASQILVNDPTCAKIEVADFRVAHLSGRQSDIETAGAQGCTRVDALESGVKRSPRQQGSVPVLFALNVAARVAARAIEKDED